MGARGGGELSLASAGLVEEAVTKALADSGRVLVDLSGLRVTWPPAVQLFGSILAGMGGWPGMRLVLFGADTALVRLLDALRVSVTVPVTPDETTAYRLLKRRPPAVARYLDLGIPEISDASGAHFRASRLHGLAGWTSATTPCSSRPSSSATPSCTPGPRAG